jgi:hypothetical protein
MDNTTHKAYEALRWESFSGSFVRRDSTESRFTNGKEQPVPPPHPELFIYDYGRPRAKRPGTADAKKG